MAQNMYELLIGAPPAEPALACLETTSGQTFTYGDADGHSARMANLLAARGIVAGDRVVVQVEKSAQAVFLYLACLRAGAVYLPLNTSYTGEETRYLPTHSGDGIGSIGKCGAAHPRDQVGQHTQADDPQQDAHPNFDPAVSFQVPLLNAFQHNCLWLPLPWQIMQL